ncbi:hypothetical protein FHU41_000676 [Psychromicrobium silvestre]|uniref:Thioesterase-like superfamily n=1 Tax=Psychromicrobium silvestre TaxID=1645614 RepID=A0A7Y9LRW2_9MICC|nr:hypothetical protein [Psychromicrobium silvestre]
MQTEENSYYVRLGEGQYRSTIHAQGAWNPHEQHMAPVSGILTRELEAFQPREDLRMARISFDILGLIPAGEFSVECKVLRPGKTIELVQAELIAGGRAAVRATAWRLQRSDTSAVAALADTPMPALAQTSGEQDMTVWPGGYIRSLQLRAVAGLVPGRGQAWLHTEHEMVDGEATADLVRLVGLVDTANGVAPRVDPSTGEYLYPNTDLSIHLYRQPAGKWLGLDTSVTFGDDGIGLTSSILNDELGPFGRAEQILTIRAIRA